MTKQTHIENVDGMTAAQAMHSIYRSMGMPNVPHPKLIAEELGELLKQGDGALSKAEMKRILSLAIPMVAGIQHGLTKHAFSGAKPDLKACDMAMRAFRGMVEGCETLLLLSGEVVNPQRITINYIMEKNPDPYKIDYDRGVLECEFE